MTMELTDEQVDAIVRSIPGATPMEDRRAIVRGVWKACAPLFRTAVLEEAARVVESAETGWCETSGDLRGDLAFSVRALKGAP
jgi:hypothetical protein